MSVMVIACYRPKPGRDADLLSLMKSHLPTLKTEGLVGDGPAMAGRAMDGTLVEIFCWKSQASIDAAHSNPTVGAMWRAFGEACDYVTIADVAGARDLFTPLDPVDLS